MVTPKYILVKDQCQQNHLGVKFLNLDYRTVQGRSSSTVSNLEVPLSEEEAARVMDDRDSELPKTL